MQLVHGFFLSHLTFRLLHMTHERRFRPALRVLVSLEAVQVSLVVVFCASRFWQDIVELAMLILVRLTACTASERW